MSFGENSSQYRGSEDKIDRLRIKGVISEIARTNLDLQEFSDRGVNYEISSFCYHHFINLLLGKDTVQQIRNRSQFVKIAEIFINIS